VKPTLCVESGNAAEISFNADIVKTNGFDSRHTGGILL